MNLSFKSGRRVIPCWITINKQNKKPSSLLLFLLLLLHFLKYSNVLSLKCIKIRIVWKQRASGKKKKQKRWKRMIVRNTLLLSIFQCLVALETQKPSFASESKSMHWKRLHIHRRSFRNCDHSKLWLKLPKVSNRLSFLISSFFFNYRVKIKTCIESNYIFVAKWICTSFPCKNAWRNKTWIYEESIQSRRSSK